jgi:hypothetical protein
MSMGLANPMPAFDPEGEMIAVLTPALGGLGTAATRLKAPRLPF